MRRRRGIGQLFVVCAPPPDAGILLGGRHRVEGIQIVQPLLHRHKARSFDAGATVLHQRGGCRSLTLRVFGAVLIPCQVAAMAIGAATVTKGVDHLLQAQGTRQRPLDATRLQYQVALIGAAQPAPQRAGSR